MSRFLRSVHLESMKMGMARCSFAGVMSEALESRVLLSGSPRVTNALLRPGAQVFDDNIYFGFQFDQPVNGFKAENIVATSVEQPGVSHHPAEFPYNPGLTYVSFAFGYLPPGQYELRLLSGDGKFEGQDGADLDGESIDGALPSGDLTAGGDYVTSFTTFPREAEPLTPQSLRTFALSSSAIELQWFDDTERDYGFVIDRAEGDGPFTQLVEKFQNGYNPSYPQSYIDKTASPGVVYRYRIRLIGYVNDGRSDSAYSNESTCQVRPPELFTPIETPSEIGPDSTRPDWLTRVGSTVFFTLAAGPHPNSWVDTASRELWALTDGQTTPERIFTGAPQQLIDFNGTLYFSGYDGIGGQELWKSDGTAAGTARVADVKPDDQSSSPRMLGVAGDELYFAVPEVGQSYEIWETDGSAEGTRRVSDRLMFLDDMPDAAFAARHLFGISNGLLYFRRGDETGADTGELWRTDGTTPGTRQVSGISDPRLLTDFNGVLYLAADVTTPTSVGLFKVLEDASAQSSTGELVFNVQEYDGFGIFRQLARVGDRLYFTGSAPARSSEQPYVSDGTTAGTRLLKLLVGNSNVGPYDFVGAGDAVYFFDSNFPPVLRKTDGTDAGTTVVRGYDFTYDYPTHSPAFLLSAGDQVVYSDVKSLWRSDGTYEGTYQISPLGAEETEGKGLYGFEGQSALVVGDHAYFSAKAENFGRQLRVATLTPPAKPTDLAATSGGAQAGVRGSAAPGKASALATKAGVHLTWRDASSNESGFVVERSSRADFSTVSGVLYADADATTLLDADAESATAHYYRIRAVNAGGTSDYSNVAEAGPAKARVVRHNVFYNHSVFDKDGNDDAAIAPNKSAVTPGATVQPGNFTSYTKGLNGIMIDVAGLPDGDALTADDFSFRFSQNVTFDSSVPSPAPAEINVRRGAGAQGSDRITLIWNDYDPRNASLLSQAVANGWLEITLQSNARTGLAGPDVFIYGNLAADTGNFGYLTVDASDLVRMRNAVGAGGAVGPENVFDVDRSGAVNAVDLVQVRNNLGHMILFPVPRLQASAPTRAAFAPVRSMSSDPFGRTPIIPKRDDVLLS